MSKYRPKIFTPEHLMSASWNQVRRLAKWAKYPIPKQRRWQTDLTYRMLTCRGIVDHLAYLRHNDTT